MAKESPPWPPPLLKLVRILCKDFVKLIALAQWYSLSFSPCGTLGEDLRLRSHQHPPNVCLIQLFILLSPTPNHFSLGILHLSKKGHLPDSFATKHGRTNFGL